MIKKILPALLLLPTLGLAEVTQKGFFVGVDYTAANVTTTYQLSGAISGNNYEGITKDQALSFKAGYQYYFTKVYGRYHGFHYNDEKRSKYTIDGKTFELSAEYIPVWYINSAYNFIARGVFGATAGYTKATLGADHDVNLLPVGEEADTQISFLYGFQAGVLIESEYGLSLETGLRFREGNMLEYVDKNQNSVVFTQKNYNYYIGINYLF